MVKSTGNREMSETTPRTCAKPETPSQSRVILHNTQQGATQIDIHVPTLHVEEANLLTTLCMETRAAVNIQRQHACATTETSIVKIVGKRLVEHATQIPAKFWVGFNLQKLTIENKAFFIDPLVYFYIIKLFYCLKKACLPVKKN